MKSSVKIVGGRSRKRENNFDGKTFSLNAAFCIVLLSCLHNAVLLQITAAHAHYTTEPIIYLLRFSRFHNRRKEFSNPRSDSLRAPLRNAYGRYTK